MNARFAFNGQAGEVLRRHVERDSCDAKLSAKFRLYYRLRPWIPVPVRQWMQRSRNSSLESANEWYLHHEFLRDWKTAVLAESDQPLIHPWPDGNDISICLTHDVETQAGHALVDRLAALEESMGFRSAWNFVPHKYRVDHGLLESLVARGHEIGIHGYNHDGRLFESRRTFQRRTPSINKALSLYKSRGFRAPMVHRNLEWIQELDVEFDSSCFDVDPFQAMPGGVGGVWPFIAGKVIELPYTLPQDHTLFVSLGETCDRIWIDKFAHLKSMAGMALLITHPDYLADERSLGIYRSFLDHLTTQSNVWRALPSEIADWWRCRDRMELQTDSYNQIPAAYGQLPQITGEYSDRARVVTFGELGKSQEAIFATA
ncbi:MAG: hypothetical protein ACR2NZ_04430 [Rubripirellula sp.]